MAEYKQNHNLLLFFFSFVGININQILNQFNKLISQMNAFASRMLNEKVAQQQRNQTVANKKSSINDFTNTTN